MPDETRIGDFKRPLVDPAPATTVAIDNPALSGRSAEALEAKEKALSAEASRDEAALQPLAEYEKQLAALGISKAKATEIVDAILTQGFYSEAYPITRKISVAFRTRGRRDVTRAQGMIEARKLSYDVHYADAIQMYLVAASLERFGSHALQHPAPGASVDEIEKAYASRLSYVDGLGEPAFEIIRAKWFKFDQMILAVVKEGSIENF